MVRAILIFSVAASTLMTFFPFVEHYLVTNLAFPDAIRHVRLAVFLPGAIVGSIHCFRSRTFAGLLPAVPCILYAFIGIAWVEPSERGRGLIIAASLAIMLPYAALIVENKCWELCAKTFLVSSALVFFLLCIPNSGWEFGTFVVDGFKVTNRNCIATMLSFAVFLLLSLYYRGAIFPNSSQKSNAATAIILLCFISGVALSASRAGFIILAFLISSMVYYHVKTHRYLKIAFCMAGLICYALLICTLHSNFIKSSYPLPKNIESSQLSLFTRFTCDKTVFTLGDRTTAWYSGLSYMLEHPRYLIFGVGSGGAEAAVARQNAVLKNGILPRIGRDNVPRFFTHAFWLEWFMCYGLLGLIPGGFFAAFVLSRAIRLDQRDGTYDRRIFLAFLIIANLSGITTRLPFSLAIGCLFLAAMSKQLSFPKTVLQGLYARGQEMTKEEPHIQIATDGG